MSRIIRELKIKDVKLKNNLILAPMAGFSEVGMRSLARKKGAGLTVTEMVSAKALYFKNQKTLDLLKREDNDCPSAAQIFGNDPKIMAQMIGQEPLSSFEIIDINMGCPMPKITKNGEGSALLNNPQLAADIVEACVKADKRPITVKIRSGYQDSEIVCARFAALMEEAGASMITLHARTRAQGYSGRANPEHFKMTKSALKNIPLIANGDISSYDDLLRLDEFCAPDGYMIGRAALGNVQIFDKLLFLDQNQDDAHSQNQDDAHSQNQDDAHSQNHKACLRANDISNRALFNLISEHIQILNSHFSDRYTTLLLRGHIAHYLKGIKGSRELKPKIFKAQSTAEILSILSLLNNEI